ncbi:LysR family transcriptional regulator [Marinomonas piezotolerans]|uniref:LysR family transcriptional regulator n=1 Tax=Marinomonas piezotolerans TaxID=2213058 RepID=A0A370U8M5_9GAMM|nr:LysR family transcriptional regulator [Marinomonas piezotolerans]RDL44124.1 LysR family transcriptional regulator [Marinomonas piezotolerans]
MRIEDLLKLDIKLLVSFQVILEECSVSRAAERLGVTQPALSKSLQRLRDLFNDPLFTRQAYGLSPTSRAYELSELIAPILGSMSNLLQPTQFDQATLKRRFNIKADEEMLLTFNEPMLAMLHYQAPNIRLMTSNWTQDGFDDLMNGVDLGILNASSTPNNIRSKLVGVMDACVILSESHPLYFNEEITLSDLVKHNTVVFNIRNFRSATTCVTIEKLERLGYVIEPKIETDSIAVTIEAVKRGMALIGTAQLGEVFTDIVNFKEGLSAVRVVPLPQDAVDADPYKGRHPVQICWHERYDKDPAHKWFREQVLEFMRQSPWMHSE